MGLNNLEDALLVQRLHFLAKAGLGEESEYAPSDALCLISEELEKYQGQESEGDNLEGQGLPTRVLITEKSLQEDVKRVREDMEGTADALDLIKQFAYDNAEKADSFRLLDLVCSMIIEQARHIRERAGELFLDLGVDEDTGKYSQGGIDFIADTVISDLEAKIKPKLQYLVDSNVDLTDEGLQGYWEISSDVIEELLEVTDSIINGLRGTSLNDPEKEAETPSERAEAILDVIREIITDSSERAAVSDE